MMDSMYLFTDWGLDPWSCSCCSAFCFGKGVIDSEHSLCRPRCSHDLYRVCCRTFAADRK